MVRMVSGFFWSDFRILDFARFGSRFRPADQRHHWQHPGDAAARLSASRGAHPWPDSLIFLVHVVVGFLDGFRISDFRMAISTGVRAEIMVDGLPRAVRYGRRGFFGARFLNFLARQFQNQE